MSYDEITAKLRFSQPARLSRRATLLRLAATLISGTGVIAYLKGSRLWSQMLEEMTTEILPPSHYPQPREWPDRGLYATWLGHSTVLIKINGFTILTDPALWPKIGVTVGPVTFGFKRLVHPAVQVQHLPKIDLILLSHAHMDHFDIPSLQRLERRGSTVVTACQTSDLLRTDRYKAVHELRWGDHVRVGPVLCSAFEVKHWGARLRHDHYRGYNGYMLQAGRYRVMFAGDTALTGALRKLKSSKPIDLAIIPIGAYNPYIGNHCTPEQAWKMGNEAGAVHFLPVHHRTFRLSDEPVLEPIERLMTVAGSEDYRVPIREVGQEFEAA